MKEEHTHKCAYEYININYTGRLRFVALYDDNGIILFGINFLEEYTEEEIENMTRECVDEIDNHSFE